MGKLMCLCDQPEKGWSCDGQCLMSTKQDLEPLKRETSGNVCEGISRSSYLSYKDLA